jgi:hypothetical protein
MECQRECPGGDAKRYRAKGWERRQTPTLKTKTPRSAWLGGVKNPQL